jgi:tripartite ATP-independent transporter DctM subunit
MFMVYIFFNGVYLKKKGQYNIVDTEAESLSTWQAIKGIAPIVITIVVLLGSLYTGKATPVESAALGTFIVLVFGFASKGLSWKKIVESAKSTSKSIAMILTLMISASYLTFALSQSSVNRHLTTWVIDQGFTPLAILTIIGLIYLVLGCFMDGSSMIMLTIPLLAPICKELGVDLIWFGVYITLLVQIGQVTPPMGLNLFMVQGIDKEAKLNDIIRGVIPFLIGMLIFAVLMIMFPQMTAWLPEVMGF